MHIRGFLSEFRRVHETMEDRSFAFVLGAGASKTSGIKTGGELVSDWLAELYQMDPRHIEVTLDKWTKAGNVEVEGFNPKDPGASYPAVYARRFRDDPEAGYAYLEDAMKDAEPSFGYSVLAKLLANERHRVVITTNFDNLIADALSIYTTRFPLVCGHESLAGFIRPALRRPLVIKVHRDLLLAPMSTSEELKELDEGYRKALTGMFVHYTPIVVGYGGNDGTLMGLLELMEPKTIRGGIWWCYREEDGLPGARMQHVVARQRGHLVAIPGFDELMLMLNKELDYELDGDGAVMIRATERAKQYIKQVHDLEKKVAESEAKAEPDSAVSPAREAFDAAMAEKDRRRWWQWRELAEREHDVTKKKQLYREALAALPHDASMAMVAAMFFARFDSDEAERLHKRALELDPDEPTVNSNYATFLAEFRGDYDGAERLHKRAVELAPDDPSMNARYATFLAAFRGDYDGAERLHKRALEFAPDGASVNARYAIFLAAFRGDYDGAERLHKRAVELAPDEPSVNANYATFLAEFRGDYDEAERLHKRALELDPDEPTVNSNYAIFLDVDRGDYDGAERLHKRALELAPNHGPACVNYAGFLLGRSRFAEGSVMAQSACTLLNSWQTRHASRGAVLRGLLRRKDDADDTPALGRLKGLFTEQFQFGSPVVVESVLAAFRPEISEDDYTLYQAIAAALGDRDKVDNLETLPRWRVVEPILWNEPWPD